ncbi:MAG: hypothetical protein J5517_00765 [Eubacterium sp.]|nr:hypothetical protein [Eubacterium sp.]
MKYTGLGKKYINIEGSFGGSQEWFKDIGMKWKGRAIEGYGCGLVGAADLLLHILGNDIIPNDRSEKNSLITKDIYISFLRRLEKRYFHIFPKLGLSGILLALGINLYLFFHRKEIRENTGYKYHARWAVRPSKLLERIKEMLGNDIPVIIAIGPGFFRKEKVRFYNKRKDDKGRTVFKPVTKTKDHYVTVTGVEEGEHTFLEISSWGKKYYINFDEYLEYVKKNDNFYFSNILYVSRK